ncbi:unnamed protein product [Ambrosiozyma monospora]|uniref:Unnamed protein product n=1 Tax=Ambrosiozyma monospora TaxID=43982 RepID=A0ACB5U1Q8_AMBMO|nr:unnamed protein product [Ambrosiozyma monospora]
MSLKVNENKGLFYISYTCVPIHTHSIAEIVATAKQKYRIRTGSEDGGIDLDTSEVEQCPGDESNSVGDIDDTYNPELRVQAIPRLLVSFHYAISHEATEHHMAVSTTTNGQTILEEEVRIKVLDDEYDFHGNHDEDHGSHLGLVPPDPEEISRISHVTRSLATGHVTLSNADDLDGFEQDLGELMYYTNKLYDAVH